MPDTWPGCTASLPVEKSPATATEQPYCPSLADDLEVWPTGLLTYFNLVEAWKLENIDWHQASQSRRAAMRSVWVLQILLKNGAMPGGQDLYLPASRSTPVMRTLGDFDHRSADQCSEGVAKMLRFGRGASL